MSNIEENTQVDTTNPPKGKKVSRPASPKKPVNKNLIGKTKKLTLTDLTNSGYLYGREHVATFKGSDLQLSMPKKTWQDSGMPTTLEVTFK